MRISFLLIFSCFFAASQAPLFAQSYTNIIDQQLTDADLIYMPAEELMILKNEIIAIKGARSTTKGNTNSQSPFAQYSCTVQFLSTRDQANINLINQMLSDDPQVPCSEKEMYELFAELAQSKQQMPLYLSKKFYGTTLNLEMSKHQKVVQISDQIMAFWVPQFSTCEDCPYENYFVTINKEGKKSGSLNLGGMMTILENNILEVKTFDKSPSTTTQPEYYQILASGKLDFTGNQMTQANTN